MKNLLQMLICIPFLLFPLVKSTSMASSNTANMTVSFKVLAVCKIDPTHALTFSSTKSDDKNTTATASGSFDVHCTLRENACVMIDNGLNAGSGNSRKLKSLTNYINYSLYSDNDHQSNWNASKKSISYTSDGHPHQMHIYGKAFIDKNTAPGVYTDQVRISPSCNSGTMRPDVMSIILVVTK